jgi:hypothetical protein
MPKITGVISQRILNKINGQILEFYMVMFYRFYDLIIKNNKTRASPSELSVL